MAVIAKTLYGTDFAEWAAHTAELLRQRRFDEIDVENVADEILLDAIDLSPSLRRRLAGRLDEIYQQALTMAQRETGIDAPNLPAGCPFKLEDLLAGDPTRIHF